MIHLSRIHRQIRGLGTFDESQLASALAIAAGVLVQREMLEAADVVHEAVTKLREIDRRKVAERRRSA